MIYKAPTSIKNQKKIVCLQNGKQKRRTVSQWLETLRHGFYSSITKRSLQKQCKNYPKIHGQTEGGGTVVLCS